MTLEFLEQAELDYEMERLRRTIDEMERLRVMKQRFLALIPENYHGIGEFVVRGTASTSSLHLSIQIPNRHMIRVDIPSASTRSEHVNYRVLLPEDEDGTEYWVEASSLAEAIVMSKKN